MTSSKDIVLIGGVIRELRKAGSWTGETHIQKTSYVAQVCRGVPLEAEFVLYKHGPYSFDLNKSLSHMRFRSVAAISPNPGYGPSFELNEDLWTAIDKALGKFFRSYEKTVQEVCGLLAKKNVAELERLATAVFVATNFAEISPIDMTNKLVELKPHISREEAAAAFAEARSYSFIPT